MSFVCFQPVFNFMEVYLCLCLLAALLELMESSGNYREPCVVVGFLEEPLSAQLRK